jgi:COP9 signalosome complex subunit 5
MGQLLGTFQGDTVIVLDTFALPGEGTETRVTALDEAYEYMVTYKELLEKVWVRMQCACPRISHGMLGRLQVMPRENTVGWYHSHPGFGCYLSGIDVDTTRNHQKYMGPYIAIVVCMARHRRRRSQAGRQASVYLPR